MEKTHEEGLESKGTITDFFKSPLRSTIKKVLSLNTTFILFGILCLGISSILTFFMGFIEMLTLLLGGSESLHLPGFLHVELPEEFNAVICKILETNLIAVILFICAVGLYYLFWKDIHIPSWLQIKDVNQLKEKLVGIIITVLGVTFLEHALEWEHAKETLMFGAAISLIIVVLVFYSKVLSSEEHGHHTNH